MKTTFKKQRGILLVLMSLFVMIACQDDNETSITEDEVALDDELAQRSAEIDLISDDIGLIVDDAAQEFESAVSFLPACVTISTQVSGGFSQLTLDFGDGCELPNGNIVSGIIMMSQDVNAQLASRIIQVTFSNFTRNGVLVEGTRSVTRVLSNDAGNPQSTAAVDMQVTWPNGATYTRQGTRTREWIEGVNNGTWTDNVFSITGSGTTTGVLGNTHSATITTALRREATCAFIVSGVVELSRNSNTGILAYGDGTCDGEATWTGPNGNTIAIFLD
ncbi:hypothetical protein KORDIASMS9_02126 [Kordia sp. SMS9]|uniref:hypothetical protein n=1 Tax=Kordia sp. SMS9 TaxID=2282170 RepID=UPI000E0D27FC|nr:hypothetical protein [Kordia sp. SMS9]AXG69898.1 hypothetical protein KORDIASMS9_02126 [Kordia sp. SMS9]